MTVGRGDGVAGKSVPGVGCREVAACPGDVFGQGGRRPADAGAGLCRSEPAASKGYYGLRWSARLVLWVVLAVGRKEKAVQVVLGGVVSASLGRAEW